MDNLPPWCFGMILKKKFAKLLMGKQKVHQMHEINVENWQGKN
jgi:hypothetical protein